MKAMIEALTIFLKYVDDVPHPFHCEHDVLHVHGAPSQSQVTVEDAACLDALGFHWDADDEHWYSFRFGSC